MNPEMREASNIVLKEKNNKGNPRYSPQIVQKYFQEAIDYYNNSISTNNKQVFYKVENDWHTNYFLGPGNEKGKVDGIGINVTINKGRWRAQIFLNNYIGGVRVHNGKSSKNRPPEGGSVYIGNIKNDSFNGKGYQFVIEDGYRPLLIICNDFYQGMITYNPGTKFIFLDNGEGKIINQRGSRFYSNYTNLTGDGAGAGAGAGASNRRNPFRSRNNRAGARNNRAGARNNRAGARNNRAGAGAGAGAGPPYSRVNDKLLPVALRRLITEVLKSLGNSNVTKTLTKMYLDRALNKYSKVRNTNIKKHTLTIAEFNRAEIRHTIAEFGARQRVSRVSNFLTGVGIKVHIKKKKNSPSPMGGIIYVGNFKNGKFSGKGYKFLLESGKRPMVEVGKFNDREVFIPGIPGTGVRYLDNGKGNMVNKRGKNMILQETTAGAGAGAGNTNAFLNYLLNEKLPRANNSRAGAGAGTSRNPAGALAGNINNKTKRLVNKLLKNRLFINNKTKRLLNELLKSPLGSYINNKTKRLLNELKEVPPRRIRGNGSRRPSNAAAAVALLHAAAAVLPSNAAAAALPSNAAAAALPSNAAAAARPSNAAATAGGGNIIRRHISSFKKNNFTGEGLAFFNSNDKRYQYVGRFKNGKFNGNGRLNLKNRTYIVGKWKNGEINKGTMHYRNGKTYTGAFKNLVPHGTGVLVGGNMAQEGEWKNGIYIGPSRPRNNGAGTSRAGVEMSNNEMKQYVNPYVEALEKMRKNTRTSQKRKATLPIVANALIEMANKNNGQKKVRVGNEMNQNES